MMKGRTSPCLGWCLVAKVVSTPELRSQTMFISLHKTVCKSQAGIYLELSLEVLQDICELLLSSCVFILCVLTFSTVSAFLCSHSFSSFLFAVFVRCLCSQLFQLFVRRFLFAAFVHSFFYSFFQLFVRIAFQKATLCFFACSSVCLTICLSDFF